MAKLPAPPDSNVEPGRSSITNIPSWMKLFGVIVLVLVLLFVILHLTGLHGGHTPPDVHGGHDPSKWGHK